jgi:hypothetical protein
VSVVAYRSQGRGYPGLGRRAPRQVPVHAVAGNCKQRYRFPYMVPAIRAYRVFGSFFQECEHNPSLRDCQFQAIAGESERALALGTPAE